MTVTICVNCHLPGKIRVKPDLRCPRCARDHDRPDDWLCVKCWDAWLERLRLWRRQHSLTPEQEIVWNLLAAMDAWAADEDGIPEEAWDAYAAACDLVGKCIPLTSRPWFDPT